MQMEMSHKTLMYITEKTKKNCEEKQIFQQIKKLYNDFVTKTQAE